MNTKLILFILATNFYNGVITDKDTDETYDADSERRDYPYNEELHKNREISQQEEEVRQWILKQKFLIANYCNKVTNECYDIIDEYFLGEGSRRILGYRTLYTKNEKKNLKLSRSILESPIPLTWENADSRKWKVRKDYVRLLYAKQMITGPFLTGSLRPNTKKTYNVLILGLAGGVITNFLSNLDFIKLNITTVDIEPLTTKMAKEWYDVKEDELNHIVIEDAIEFVRKAAERREKYDAIIVDVCYSVIDKTIQYLCPLNQFMEQEFLLNSRNILSSNGTFMLNLIYNEFNEVFNNENINLLQSHFTECYQEFGTRMIETMVYCDFQIANLPDKNPKMFLKRYTKIRDLLKTYPTHIEDYYEKHRNAKLNGIDSKLLTSERSVNKNSEL